MRVISSFVAASLLQVLAAGGAPARWTGPAPRLLVNEGPSAVAAAPAQTARGDMARGDMARGDTVYFGGYDRSTGWAIEGDTWTWDHDPSGPPYDTEGWTSRDLTGQVGTFFRRITAQSWAGHGNGPAAPVITGQGSVWCGAFEDTADSLCWAAGLGYGNMWCQNLDSPELMYSGSGGIMLSLRYFNDSEEGFDYTKIYLRKRSTEILLNETSPNAHDGFSGKVHVLCSPSDSCRLDIPTAPWTRTVTAAQMGEAGPFTIRLRFESDGGWSDEDGEYVTSFGPFGTDDVQITGGAAASYDFENSLEGWTPGGCPGIGSFFGIADLGSYSIPDPCHCSLSGRVMEFHGPLSGSPHPEGQMEEAVSPPIDRSHLPGYDKIFVDMEAFADMPPLDGVYYRIGWQYYPWICPNTGEARWSERAGRANWYYHDGTDCFTIREVATEYGIPADCQYLRVVVEIYVACDFYPCDQPHRKFSPVFDNIRVGLTRGGAAPSIGFLPGALFQDGFPQQGGLSTQGTGNADVTQDLHGQDDGLPDLLGDSLSIEGPLINAPRTNRWEARLFFRVRREGPAQTTILPYNTWLSRVKDGLPGIVGPTAPFTFGWMDSVETITVQRNRFCSQFREDDDDFAPGPPGVGYDQAEENEILPDGIFTPGTKIEYFVAANYICTPNEVFTLPDTFGGCFEEFEILPSYRMDNGVACYPCVLLVDGADAGGSAAIENALNGVLHGALPGAPLPDPAGWDRYDYADAGSNWSAPLFRAGAGNSGAAPSQLLGYRVLLVSTGAVGGPMERRDWTGLSDWLQVSDCSANGSRQGLLLNGENVAGAINLETPGLLAGLAGAALACETYSNPSCPPGDPDNDENWCVRLENAAGGPYAPALALDLYANGCPAALSYDVLSPAGGVGNKVYAKIGTETRTDFAQITNEQSSPGNPAHYRSVLDGFSYLHMATRDLLNPGPSGECPSDAASVAAAARAEISSAIGWVLDLHDPSQLGLCLDPCTPPEPNAVEESGNGSPVSGLWPSRPNPFNPRTVIRYSLASEGPARVDLFDATGRRVRTLVQGAQKAGWHEVVWDGTDDAGHALGAGVYWSRLEIPGYASSRKLVLLRRDE